MDAYNNESANAGRQRNPKNWGRLPNQEMLLLYRLSIFFLVLSSLTAAAPLPTRFLNSSTNSTRKNGFTQEYFQITHPVPTDLQTPSCSLLLLHRSFAVTAGSPPISVNYYPPYDCPGPWTSVILQFEASCAGAQRERIAAVWIDGVELLRTSTPQPTARGAHWKVRKDVSKYSSALARPNSTVSVMLRNVVTETLPGIYRVNVTAFFYGGKNESIPSSADSNRKIRVFSEEAIDNEEKIEVLAEEGEVRERKLGVLSDDDDDEEMLLANQRLGISLEGSNLESKLGFPWEQYADVIIPISSDGYQGFWFKIQSPLDTPSKSLRIPVKTYRAVLEIYVSFHSNDEFWYANPPNPYIQENNLTTLRGNWSFREVVAKVDGIYVGSVVPFPVILPGGINPFFWDPIVGIGAFSLPSYDLELTPFLGLLLDDNLHSFELGVEDGINFWLVNANLHLWLDGTSQVEAKLVEYIAPPISISRKCKIKHLDGSFKINAERNVEFLGWVNSLSGNLTTHVKYELEFSSKIKFKDNGSLKKVKQKIESKTQVRVGAYSVLLLARSNRKTESSLEIETSTRPIGPNTSLIKTELSTELEDESSLALPTGISITSLSDSQECEGWTVEQGHSVLSGSGTNQQEHEFKDEMGCYSHKITATDGEIQKESFTYVCDSAL